MLYPAIPWVVFILVYFFRGSRRTYFSDFVFYCVDTRHWKNMIFNKLWAEKNKKGMKGQQTVENIKTNNIIYIRYRNVPTRYIIIIFFFSENRDFLNFLVTVSFTRQETIRKKKKNQ